MNNRLLVVEDDESLRLTLVDNLELEGYEVFWASTIAEAKSVISQQSLASQEIELIVLDLMLPDGSGYDLCEEIRLTNQRMMILMLTARTLDTDLQMGFNKGADDYLTKPYKVAELLLRIKALLRRTSSAQRSVETSIINGAKINWQKHSVTKNGQEIHLTKKEFDLLKLLFDNLDQPLTRDDILSQVWGDEVYVEERTVDNFISNIRKALDLNEHRVYFVKTVRGVGYALMRGVG
jgi:two-component system phosphate regulon response regulator PhoB